MTPNPLPAANSRRPLRFQRREETRCCPASLELGSPAAVAEGDRSAQSCRLGSPNDN